MTCCLHNNLRESVEHSLPELWAKESRVPNARVLIVFAPMFDLQDDRQITIEQEPVGPKEGTEEEGEDERQKGYSS